MRPQRSRRTLCPRCPKGESGAADATATVTRRDEGGRERTGSMTTNSRLVASAAPTVRRDTDQFAGEIGVP